MLTAHWSKLHKRCSIYFFLPTSAYGSVVSCQCLFTAALAPAVIPNYKALFNIHNLEIPLHTVSMLMCSISIDNYFWQTFWHSERAQMNESGRLCYVFSDKVLYCQAPLWGWALLLTCLSVSLAAKGLQSWIQLYVEGFVCERSEGIRF